MATEEFVICRLRADDGRAPSPTGVSLALRGRPRRPWPAKYGWSYVPYCSRFASLTDAIDCIHALGLADVEIRRVVFPLPEERLPVVWPESAIQAGLNRVAAYERRFAEQRATAALAPKREFTGDPDAWYGDRSDD